MFQRRVFHELHSSRGVERTGRCDSSRFSLVGMIPVVIDGRNVRYEALRRVVRLSASAENAPVSLGKFAV